MCSHVIEHIYHSNEPIVAYKLQEWHSWSIDLGKLVGKEEWILARPRVIRPGGGPGIRFCQLSEPVEWTKSFGYTLSSMMWASNTIYSIDFLPGVHLSFWHASQVPISSVPALGSYVYKIELRGIIQTAQDEITGSEMRVIRRF